MRMNSENPWAALYRLVHINPCSNAKWRGKTSPAAFEGSYNKKYIFAIKALLLYLVCMFNATIVLCGGWQSGSLLCICLYVYMIHSARWWKCYFSDPNKRSRQKKDEKLPPARRATSQFPPWNVVFMLELCIYLCWVFPLLLFGIPFKCFQWRKSLLSNFLCAWILSIFPFWWDMPSVSLFMESSLWIFAWESLAT